MRNNNKPITKTKIRKSVSAFFFISALCFSSWTSRISFIQESLQLNDGQFGLFLFCLPFGVLLSLPISSNLIKRYGSRNVLIVGSISLTTTLLMLSFSNDVYITGFFLILFGFANNATNLSINIQAIETERIFGKSIMGSFHGIWSFSAVLGSLFGSFCMSLHLPVYIQFLSIVSVAVTILTISYKHLIYKKPTNTTAEVFIFKFGNKNILILGIIALCSMIGEGSMYDWSEIYLKRTVQSSHLLSSIGYSMFMFSMLIGRFISDFSVTKIGFINTIKLAGTISIIGFAICVLGDTYTIIIIGYFLIGLGTSSIIPVVYSAVTLLGKEKTNQYITAISSIGFLGLLFAPPFIGLLAEQYSIKIAFIFILGITSIILVISQKLKLPTS